jgi:hypothetical protein
LFCTGTRFPIPPALAAEHIYVFEHSSGWDGQFYHYMAHDPFLAGRIWKYTDTPVLRYRRILVPALAWLLAGGDSRRVDVAYHAVILLFFALGAYWLSRLAALYGHSRAWALAFVAIPAAIASMDRMAVDVALAAFVLAFAWFAREGQKQWPLYWILMLAPLVRETGLLLVAAYCLWLLRRKRVRLAAAFATTALPALAWFKYVDLRTPPFIYLSPVVLPFSGALHRLLHLTPYPSSLMVRSVVWGFDTLAVAGVLLAFAIALPAARRTGWSPTGWAMLLFVLLGVFMWRPGDWPETSDYGRILSPLLILLAVEPLASRSTSRLKWLPVAPLCMLAPRCAIQLAPQVLSLLGATAWIPR